MNWLDYFDTAEPVTLEQALAAREARARTQQSLLGEHGCPLISFTLNIPGEHKTYPLARMAFDEGHRQIAAQLEEHGLPVRHRRQTTGVAGYEGFHAVDGPPGRVKALMLAIEEGHPLGRLFDIDVLETSGEILHGSEQGRRERTCLLCGGPVWVCARSRAHPVGLLAVRAAELIRDYFANDYADDLAAKATRALLYEVASTPKPGLVDRANNGAHRDMDIFTFIDSGCALTPYFHAVTRQSLLYRGEPETLLATLRYTGRRAEQRMFAATGGVNTHKGLLFSLGIFCAAMAQLHALELPETPEELFRMCTRIAGGVTQELAATPQTGKQTKGQEAYARHGLTGIRGEAAAGFPSVARVGYPVLKQLAEAGTPLNDAAVITLLHLTVQVPDTNIIGRAGLDALQSVQEAVRGILAEEKNPGKLLERAERLNADFVARNISPGGCADLLALSLMVYFLFDEKK